jgi:hypothetical protein
MELNWGANASSDSIILCVGYRLLLRTMEFVILYLCHPVGQILFDLVFSGLQ